MIKREAKRGREETERNQAEKCIRKQKRRRRGEDKRGKEGRRRNRGGGALRAPDIVFLKLGCGFTEFAVFTILSSVLFCMPETLKKFF